MSAISRAIPQLSEATVALRRALDRSELARALEDGTASIASYARLLRALHAAWSEIEHIALTGQSELLRESQPYFVERRQQLERDLEHLQVDPRGVDAAALYGLVLAQHIRRDAAQSGERLIGYIEVLSAPFGSLSTTTLTARPELNGGGAEFASAAAHDARLEKLAQSLNSSAAIEHAIAGAHRALEGLASIVDVIVSNQHEDWLAGALNREAGQHPVPHDVREVQAALIAGERTREAFRYYEARYGERGLRFTRSDSAWLVTVAREGIDEARRQITWLGRLLSTRGMPRYLLESHLKELYEQLAKLVPEKLEDYAALDRIAKEMASERRKLLSEEDFTRLATEFSPATTGPIAPKEAATLLIAAVLDEKLGIATAVTSLCHWLNDAARSDEQWREAMEKTLAKARSLAAAAR